MNTAIELFRKAQDTQLTTIGRLRLAVLKASDELRSFNGEDDYQIALTTIVKEYPQGIVLTRLREVLPDSIILEKAIKSLVEKNEIISEPYGKRSQLLKPVKKVAPEPPRQEVVSVDTNPTGNPAWETMPTASGKPKPIPTEVEITE